MSSKRWSSVLERKWPLIATLHFAPLPGSPRYSGDWEAVRQRAAREAQIYAEQGAAAILLENFGDAPFYPARVPAVTLTHFTALAMELRMLVDLPLGINLLRNDALGGLAIAQAVGACFIRVNVLCGVRVSDQGLLTGEAHELVRQRTYLGATDIAILADVQVKHSAPLAERTLADELQETIDRGGADAVILTGAATGQPVDVARLHTARQVCGTTPLLVGSGTTTENVESLCPFADGFIVGTALKANGDVRREVDPVRVAALVAALRQHESQTRRNP